MSKTIIKEAQSNQTVNDEQLQGLYDAAAKTEGQIINLAVAAMKFSNADIKRAVTALKSQAGKLTELISQAIEGADGIDLGLSGEEDEEGMDQNGRIDLNAQQNDNGLIERKEINESKMKKVMRLVYELGLTQNQAMTLAEKFDPSIFDKNKKKDDKDDDKKEGEEELKEDAAGMIAEPINDQQMFPECVNLKEAFTLANNGLKNSDFNKFKTLLSETIIKNNKNKSFDTFVNKINEAKDINSINEALNVFFDFADTNNIKIITE